MSNPFNRLHSLTYNGVTVGQNSTIGEIDGEAWSVALTPEMGIVRARIIVGSTSGNALANMAAIEAAFSVRRKHLVIVYSSTTINDFDPTFATLTGYEAFPEIRHSPDLPGPHSIGAETYELTVRFRIPADNNGRRDEHPALDKSLAARKKVRFTGVWTAIAGSLGAREQFSDPTTGFEAHATTFLSNYDNASTWVETLHDVVENDTDTEVSYHCEFSVHVHGNLHEERTVHQDLHQLRRILVTGTWVDPAGVQSATAYAALAAFNDVTNGFAPQIRAWAAATYSGATFNIYAVSPRVNVINGTVDYAAELWETEDVSTVDSGRRFSRITVDQTASLARLTVTIECTYMQTVVSGVTKTADANFADTTNGYPGLVTAYETLLNARYGRTVKWGALNVLRYNHNEQLGILEATLQFKEYPLAQSSVGFLDPDIIDDEWHLTSTTEAPGDSPAVLAGQPSGTTSGTSVKRPIVLEASYRAWIHTGIDPMTKWNAVLLPYVEKVVNDFLKPATTPGALVRIVPEVDPSNNILTAHIWLESYVAAYLELSIDENVSRDLGRIFTPKLSGLEDDYLEQQGPSIGTKVRTTRLLSTQPNAIQGFMSPNDVAGYKRLRFSIGSKTVVKGTNPSTAIYAAEMVEEFLAVRSSSAGDPGSSPTITLAGTGQNAAAQGASGGGSPPSATGQPSAPQGSSDTSGAGASGGGAPPQAPAQPGGGQDFSHMGLDDFAGMSGAQALSTAGGG